MLAIVALSLFASTQAAGVYPLVQNWQGTEFFSGWTWYNNVDNTTWGNTTYLSQTAAQTANLAYMNAAGRAVIAVDNTSTVVYGGKRNSVRITSQDGYGVGSVFVMDAVHMPYGCSVWPGFWTTGANWPLDGELDIVEAINMETTNAYTVHTGNSTDCVASYNAAMTGTWQETNNCSTVANSNIAGCTIEPANTPATYGAAFTRQQGGVFAAELSETGVNMWAWSRRNIPAALSSNATTINTATWGTPAAAFNIQSPTCDVTTAFGYQQVILNIALCGLFAGYQNIYDVTCGNVRPGDCYTANVIGDGSNYNNAYFELNYVRVYSNNVSVAEVPTPAPSTSQVPVVALVSTTVTAVDTSTSLPLPLSTPVGNVVKSGTSVLTTSLSLMAACGLGALAVYL